jgi:pimeloyl-ACP methyl ester carboxylesterase
MVDFLRTDSSDSRRVAVAWSTKGAEETVYEKRVTQTNGEIEKSKVKRTTGGMRDGAAQIEMAMRMWGLADDKGETRVVHVGHSMGGREAFLLPLLMGHLKQVNVIPVAPVMSMDLDHLLLVKGERAKQLAEGFALRTVFERLQDFSPSLAAQAVNLSQKFGIIKYILNDLVASGEINLEKAQRTIEATRKNFDEVAVINTQLKQLLTELSLPKSVYAMLGNHYREMIPGVLAGRKDMILRTVDMTET